MKKKMYETVPVKDKRNSFQLGPLPRSKRNLLHFNAQLTYSASMTKNKKRIIPRKQKYRDNREDF